MDNELHALRRALENEVRGFFAPGGPIFVGRAPGRLDVMGGVADYSGSVVLESPIADAAIVALQRRTDRRLRAWSVGREAAILVRPRVEVSLDDFRADGTLKPAAAVREMLAAADARWAGYVLGAFYVLQAEREVPAFDAGADLLVLSTVPMGAGVASSAALEVAAMSAIEKAWGLQLEDMRFARLCQLVEHRVVGAPCGIMDQVTCGLGQAGELLALRCQPHDLLGYETVPDGCRFVGIDSGVKHSVGASRYVRARVGAFMGLKIIATHLGHDPYGGYLCNVSPAEFRGRFYSLIPSRMRGADFLARYGPIDDTATGVDPEVEYSPRGCAEHAVYENDRVRRFARLLAEARAGKPEAMAKAGALMYGSHWSYTYRCGLGAAETSLLVRLARERARLGVLGAKITGGGSGGTVALTIDERAWDPQDAVETIARDYAGETGIQPRIIDGTSWGARQWGVRVIGS